jgi:hypothetical protein
MGAAYAGLGQAGGGIFTDTFFTVLGGDPANNALLLIHTAAPVINLAAYGNFVHNLVGGAFPSGNFQVKGIEHTGPHPAEVYIIPEPSTAVLTGLGLVALLACARQLSSGHQPGS